MSYKIFLFDMDGVLLQPKGYHQSLKTSIQRIGQALGLPHTKISYDQIAEFEALSVTNEWDTLAICTAMILLELWLSNQNIRFNGLAQPMEVISYEQLNIDKFLNTFTNVGYLPAHSAYELFVSENPWLNTSQRSHLKSILYQSRDIYSSPILSIHQETVLGSKIFEDTYHIPSQLNIESFLSNYDIPLMTDEKLQELTHWNALPNNLAGIMTNRPSKTPNGFVSSPEAEIGAARVGLNYLPVIGSGILAWFATTQCLLPEYTFLKPNPVHALSVMQMCAGESSQQAIQSAVSLWQGNWEKENWTMFKGAKVVIFEDALKGFESAIQAKELLGQFGVDIKLELIGVSQHPIKKEALQKVANKVVDHLNLVNWGDI